MNFMRFWNCSVICGLQPHLIWTPGSLENYLPVPSFPTAEKVSKDLQHPSEMMNLCFSDPNSPASMVKCTLAGTTQPTALHWQFGFCWNSLLKVPFTAGTLNVVDKWTKRQGTQQTKTIPILLFWMQCKSKLPLNGLCMSGIFV